MATCPVQLNLNKKKKHETKVIVPEISIRIIHCIVKVHACISNKYSGSKVNQEVALHCSGHENVQLKRYFFTEFSSNLMV